MFTFNRFPLSSKLRIRVQFCSGMCLRAMEVVDPSPQFLLMVFHCTMDGASLAKIDSQDKQDIVEAFIVKSLYCLTGSGGDRVVKLLACGTR